jgi:hypothetical protein
LLQALPGTGLEEEVKGDSKQPGQWLSVEVEFAINVMPSGGAKQGLISVD